MADRRNILALGVDPDRLISFAGGWPNHLAPAAYSRAYQDIVTDDRLFHQSGDYTAPLGNDECREQIVALERTLFGVEPLSTAHVAIGAGSTQLTHDLLRVLLDPGDAVLLLDPTYVNYAPQVGRVLPELRTISVPVVDPATWTYLPHVDPNRVIDAITRAWSDARPRLAILCSPDNPTGQVLPQAIVDHVMALAQRDGAFVAIDFAYRCQCFVDRPAYFGWSPAVHENFIAIHTNSKWLRGLGRRLGWMVAASRVIDGLERVQQCSLLCPDTLHQMTMARYLRRGLADDGVRAYITETTCLFRRAAERTMETIDRLFGFPRFTPQGGLYVVADVGCDGDAFARDALREAGVLLVAGSGFGATLTRGIRFSYGPLVSTPQRIDEGLERLQRLAVAVRG